MEEEKGITREQRDNLEALLKRGRELENLENEKRTGSYQEVSSDYEMRY